MRLALADEYFFRSPRGNFNPTTVISHPAGAIERAQDQVLLASPHFVPGRAALDGLEAVRKRGVAGASQDTGAGVHLV